MANSSIECPSLSSAVSHRGVAPLPAHVSPPGPRYFGGTDLPRIALTRPGFPAGRPRFGAPFYSLPSDRQKNRHTQHGKVWREKTSASRVLAALASSPATKALDPDPFPRHSLRHAVYAALLHFGFETAVQMPGKIVGTGPRRRHLRRSECPHYHPRRFEVPLRWSENYRILLGRDDNPGWKLPARAAGLR